MCLNLFSVASTSSDDSMGFDPKTMVFVYLIYGREGDFKCAFIFDVVIIFENLCAFLRLSSFSISSPLFVISTIFCHLDF